MIDFDQLIAVIENAGYDWAVGGGLGNYSAAIEKHPCLYIGDFISGPGCCDGGTPYDALYTLARKSGIVQE